MLLLIGGTSVVVVDVVVVVPSNIQHREQRTRNARILGSLGLGLGLDLLVVGWTVELDIIVEELGELVLGSAVVVVDVVDVPMREESVSPSIF